MTEPFYKRVEAILTDCLYRDDEIDGSTAPADAVIAQGVISTFAFHPGRLGSHKADIAALCNELPDDFQKSKGGGWSFLNLCVKKSGEHWGEHRNCEQLVALAIASKQGSYPMPREMWSMLPGSMPYVQFDTAA
jgi:hypothetical protein